MREGVGDWCLREGVRERERAREGVGDWCRREGEEREVAAFQRSRQGRGGEGGVEQGEEGARGRGPVSASGSCLREGEGRCRRRVRVSR